MTTRIIAVLSLAAAWVAAGCRPEAAGGEGAAMVRDSAGITIVENPSPDDSTRNVWWRLAGPELDIGGIDAEEPYALYRVTDAVRLDDGRIVVISTGSDDVRWFDASGVHLHTSGRAGGGPGEYQNPISLLRGQADSLLVIDGTARRVSVLDPAGEFARTIDIGETSAVSRIAGRFADGSLLSSPVVFLPEGPSPDDGQISRPPVNVVRLAAVGGVADTLGEFPGAERVMHVQTSGGEVVSISIMMPPFAKSPTFAVTDDEFWVGAQDGAELRVYGRDGALRRIVRTGRLPERVTEAHLDARWERQLESMPEEMRAQQRAQGRNESLPHGEFVPAYGEIATDLEGNLWVSDYDDPLDPPGRWTIYDPMGRVLARIVLPERFDPYDAGPDWVLGRELDELDVEHVRLYHIVK